MRLNLTFIFALLVIPAVFAAIGQSCKTNEEELDGFNGYGVCTAEEDCMVYRCAGRKRCLNPNFSVFPSGECPNGGVCCIKIVKILNSETLPIPGRCLNKANCDSRKNKVVVTPECSGKNVVLCIPKEREIDFITVASEATTTIIPEAKTTTTRKPIKTFDFKSILEKLGLYNGRN